MNGWVLKTPDGILCLSPTEFDAWAAHNHDDAEYLKRQGYTCVPVTVQEPAQPAIEQRMRDDVAALGPVEALRRIKEPESAQCQHIRRDQDRCADCGKMLIVAESALAGSGEAVAMVRDNYKIEWCGPHFGIGVPPDTPLYAHPPASADEGMVSLLRECLPYVESQAGAEHMLDGFGPRSEQRSDSLLTRLKATLAARKS